jgi:hypothetical protein
MTPAMTLEEVDDYIESGKSISNETIECILRQLAAVMRENMRLRTVLSFYADEDNYDYGFEWTAKQAQEAIAPTAEG